MFIDRVTIYVRAGRGGDGCISLRHEKYVPKGGPDGGDGGDGGSVILVGDASVDTLLSLSCAPHFKADNGRPGMGKSRHGANGVSREIRVPLGTQIFDADHDTLVGEISEAEQTHVVAHSGRGGFGNEHFKTATNQTPRCATPGERGEEWTLRLELKLVADVGFVGKPNAGKSTMLRAVSRATPKVADYPFTTRWPHLGIAELSSRGGLPRRLVLADIPGLVEGAAEGAGLGHDFLRHIERTSVIAHLVDVCPPDGTDPVAAYHAIRQELAQYSSALAAKPEIIVLNKIDLVPQRDRRQTVARIAEALGGQASCVPHATSGATGEGVTELLESCWRELDKDDGRGWQTK